jgi:Flp pilus assembly protein TadG
MRCRRCEEGAAAVEFAFIGSLLICFTLGVFELGRVTFSYHRLQNAVGATTRLVELGGPTMPSEEMNAVIQEAIAERFPASEREALTFDVADYDSEGVTYKRIHVDYSLPLLIPGLGLFSDDTLVLSARQVVPLN